MALLAVFAAIGIITATGAFTSVTADRTVSVSTAGDDAALLQLEPDQASPNGDGVYSQLSNGELVLATGSTSWNNVPGSGLNIDAKTEIHFVFNVTNQGSQEVGVFIEKSDSAGTDNSDQVEFYVNGSNGYNDPGTDNSANRIDDNNDNGVDDGADQDLGVGQTVRVSMVIDLRGQNIGSGETILDSITIIADAGEA